MIGDGLSPSHATQARDTSDVGVELKQWQQVPGALHSVRLHEAEGRCQTKSDYLHFVFRVFVARRYHSTIWRRLLPAIPPAGKPNWKAVRQVFADAGCCRVSLISVIVVLIALVRLRNTTGRLEAGWP